MESIIETAIAQMYGMCRHLPRRKTEGGQEFDHASALPTKAIWYCNGHSKKKDGPSPVGAGGPEGHAENASKQRLSAASRTLCKAGWEIYSCQGLCKRPWNMFQFQLSNQTRLM